MRTIAVYTLGCKVNQYDTEAMLELFERAGYVSVPFDSEADIYLINTCTVTGTGDQKSLKTVRRVARLHPDCAIIVCGCLAQRLADEILKMDNVRLVLGGCAVVFFGLDRLLVHWLRTNGVRRFEELG